MSHSTRCWKSQSRTCRCTCGSELRVTEGGKSLSKRQRPLQSLQREETIGQHDQGQVSMESIPAASLVVIQAAFLFGIFVKLLDHPARMSQGEQLLQRGLRRKRAEPVLRRLLLLLLLGGVRRALISGLDLR